MQDRGENSLGRLSKISKQGQLRNFVATDWCHDEDLRSYCSNDGSIASEISAYLGDRLSHEAVFAVVACMSAPVLRQRLVRAGLCMADADDSAVLLTYFTSKTAQLFSPNILFDENWYLQYYADVDQCVASGIMISGFVHFVTFGLSEGRWPNPIFQSMAMGVNAVSTTLQNFDEAEYVSKTPYAQTFLRCFPIIGASQYYELYGRFLGDKPNGTASPSFPELLAEFDHSFYIDRYMGDRSFPISRESAFEHYITSGIRLGHSPNAWFDESFYRAFYVDIRKAIGSGIVACGFQHYVLGGRSEQRLPRFDLAKALEVRLPGVTAPTLLHRAPDLEQKLKPAKIRVAHDQQARIWFVMPWINPDMAFGGYIAAMELMLALHRAGHAIGIMCTQDPRADKEYFLWSERRPEIREMMEIIDFINIQDEEYVSISVEDVFVAYSIWDLNLASQLASRTSRGQAMLLAQEYEPTFHSNSSIRLLCERAYDIPHYPIINSKFLLRYLKAHRIGVFQSLDAQTGRDYAVFEHRVNPMPRQTTRELASRSVRTLVAYARPEAHAERNLFEVLLISLRRACAEGVFGPQWRFVGVGALTAIDPIALGPHHVLELRQKMSEAEYQEHVRSVDIGVSLMYAPHPSVVPFELATTGAIVVTNTFENRSAAELAAICENIVASAPSVDGIVAALKIAVERAEQFTAREARAYRPAVTTWEQSFPTEFLMQVFGSPRNAAGTVVRQPRAKTRKQVDCPQAAPGPGSDGPARRPRADGAAETRAGAKARRPQAKVQARMQVRAGPEDHATARRGER